MEIALTEEIKEVNQDTSVQITYELDEFMQMIVWFREVLEHIAEDKPEALYVERDGKLAVPSAVMDVFRQALEMDKAGDIDLDSASK